VDNVYQDPLVYDIDGQYIVFVDEAPDEDARINIINYSTIPAPEVITRAEAVDEAITYSIALG